jgi:hypothetical protein
MDTPFYDSLIQNNCIDLKITDKNGNKYNMQFVTTTQDLKEDCEKFLNELVTYSANTYLYITRNGTILNSSEDINIQLIQLLIQKYGDGIINWKLLVLNRNISYPLFEKFYDYFVKNNILDLVTNKLYLNSEIITKLINKLNNFSLLNIKYNESLTAELIEEFYFNSKIDWNFISEYTHLFLFFSEKMIEDTISKGCIDILSGHYQINHINILRKYKNRIGWRNLSFKIILSEEIINEFKDKLYWNMVSHNPSLNVDLIKYIISLGKLLDFHSISRNSCLGIPILQEYEYELNWTAVAENKVVNEKIIEQFHHKFTNKKDWYHLSLNCKLTIPLIQKFISFPWNWKRLSNNLSLNLEIINEFKSFFDYSDENNIVNQILSRDYPKDNWYSTTDEYNNISLSLDGIKFDYIYNLFYPNDHISNNYLKFYNNYRKQTMRVFLNNYIINDLSHIIVNFI